MEHTGACQVGRGPREVHIPSGSEGRFDFPSAQSTREGEQSGAAWHVREAIDVYCESGNVCSVEEVGIRLFRSTFSRKEKETAAKRGSNGFQLITRCGGLEDKRQM